MPAVMDEPILSADFRPLRVKKASELGGQGNETDFEKIFSMVAYPYLRDRAPRFVKHLAGFQLLDKDEDGDHSTGIFVFQLPGKRWYYCPVIYDRGQIKGHELLYSVADKQFIPFKEEWVNDIMARRPGVLGDPVTRNTGSMGLRGPALELLAQSPFKTASFDERFSPAVEWVVDKWAHPPVRDKYMKEVDLETFLKEAGHDAIAVVADSWLKYPSLAAAATKFYDDPIAMLKRAMGASGVLEAIEFQNFPAKKKKKRKLPLAPGSSVLDFPGNEEEEEKKAESVEVFIYSSVTDTSGLTDSEREDLMRHGVLLRDSRSDDTKRVAFKVETETELTNPRDSGLHSVMLSPGQFVDCLVMMNPVTTCGKTNFATVVNLDDTSSRVNIHPSYIWTRPDKTSVCILEHGEKAEKTFHEWWKSLPEASSLKANGDFHEDMDVPESSPSYILVGCDGRGTAPFSVVRKILTGDAEHFFEVYFEDYAEAITPGGMKRLIQPKHRDIPDRRPLRRDMLHISRFPGGKLMWRGNDLYVPADFRLLKLDNTSCGCLPIGSPPDLTQVAYVKTASLDVQRSGPEWNINGQTLRNKIAALVHLVKDQGLAEKQARYILDSLTKTDQVTESASYRLKSALGEYPLQQSGDAGVSIDSEPLLGSGGIDSQLPAEYPTFRQQRLTAEYADIGAKRQNLLHPFNPWESSVIDHGAQSGDKKLFEALTIGSVLQSTRSQDLVDRKIPALKQALSDLGEVILSLYTHKDQFKERYGEADLQDMEDNLRDGFDNLGTIVLKLREKSVSRDTGPMGDLPQSRSEAV